MSKKILAYYHSIGKEPNPNDMINELSYDTRIIREIEEDYTIPLMHTLMNIPVSRYILAHIKDLNILSILKKYDKNKYDGVLFIDMNKVCSDIKHFEEIVEYSLKNNSILATKFLSDDGVNDLKIYSSSTNRIPNGILFIPSSRVDEFLSFRLKCIEQTRTRMLSWFESGNKLTNGGNLLHRKWKYMDYGSDNLVSAYSEILRSMGVNYGFVEENCSIGTDYQKTKFKNVTIMKMSTHPILHDGSIYTFTGNKLISSGSFDTTTECVPYPRELTDKRPNKPKTFSRSHSLEDYQSAMNTLKKLLEEEINGQILNRSIIS